MLSRLEQFCTDSSKLTNYAFEWILNRDPCTVCTFAAPTGALNQRLERQWNTMNGNSYSVCISVYKLPLPLPELLYIINDFIFNECHLTRLFTVPASLLIYSVNIWFQIYCWNHILLVLSLSIMRWNIVSIYINVLQEIIKLFLCVCSCLEMKLCIASF